MTEHITIIGDGAMATACAMLLDAGGRTVTMWGPFPENIDQMTIQRENQRYMPGIPLSQSLRFDSEADSALRDAELIVSAIPTQYLRQVWQTISEHVPAGVPIVSVTKGIENDTQMRPTQVIAQVLDDPPDAARKLAALSGPSIASELARSLPATVCAASDDADFAERIQQTFTTQWLRVYTNADLLGVELAGAMKNVVALAAGILDGLQAGYNAKSALLSRGLAEITRLGVAMGAEAETFFGITGVGDLATTCFSPEGRNRSAGELLGKGIKLEDVLKQIEGVVEGVPTTRSVIQVAQKHGVEMPITAAVHAVLFEKLDPIDGIAQLMQRQPKAERIG